MAQSMMTHTRKQLQIECARAMQRYLQLVQKGGDLLGELEDGAIPEYSRDKIFANRRQEALAYAAYTRAQRRLWQFLSDSEPEVRVHETPRRKKPSNKRSSEAPQAHDRMIG
jgi:hypothetical protein